VRSPRLQENPRRCWRLRPVPAIWCLDAGTPLELTSLELRHGQCVRGKPGTRPQIVVPRGGLAIIEEDVCFQNLDFVAAIEDRQAAAAEGGILRVQASRVEFRGCSFQAAGSSSTPPAALVWSHPARQEASEISLPSGQVRLSDCVFRRVDAAVRCRTIGAVAVEMTNSLHLGEGPLVHLDHAPRLDGPIVIELSAVTLRDSGPLLRCDYQRLEEQPGPIAIQSSGCVFATAEQAALLSFAGPKAPQRLLGAIQWTGQGSLLSSQTVVAQWRQPDGRTVALDDAAVSIAGLARSPLSFAGLAENEPSASRVVRWQGPLRSTAAPGVDPTTLFWPK